MRLTQQNVAETLKSLQLKSKPHVMIHSSLLTLGRFADVPVEQIPQTFCELLQQSMGEGGTLYVPTYNYDFPKTRFADLRVQHSEMGNFAEYVRTHPEAKRSGHPMFSITGVGDNAERICKPDTPEYHPFDEHSTFARLFAEDTYLLLQGVTLGVATAVVFAEYASRAKYRFDKPFRGNIILQNGAGASGDFYHYCFPFNGEYRENYTPLIDLLNTKQALIRVKLGFGSVSLVSFKAIFDSVHELLAQDPLSLLNCRPDHFYTFKDGKEITYRI